MSLESWSDYKKLWNLFSYRRKLQYSLVLVFIILTSFAEVLSLGAIIPFLSVLISPNKVFEIRPLNIILEFLGIDSSQAVLLPITILFVLGIVLASLCRVGLLYVTTRLSFAVGADLSIEIYKRTLYQPYSVHVSRNSAEIISGITSKSRGIVTFFLQPVLILVSSFFLFFVIAIGLVAINPLLTSIASFLFVSLYFLIGLFSRKRLLRNGTITSKSQTILQKSLQEGLGAIRDVILDGTQEFYLDLYIKADIPFRRALGNSQFISSSPRFIIEAIGISIMVIFAYQLSLTSNDLLSFLPLLGGLALGAQKMLPVLQQTYSAWAALKSGKSTLRDVVLLLEKPFHISKQNHNNSKYGIKNYGSFKSKIELKNISFQYNENLPMVLENISLNIRKGQRIAFIGKTGSGKSTLVDVIMGLLPPTSGDILVDGVPVLQSNVSNWQRNIAHVPQSIYLADCTIAENIAFGIPQKEIDYDRINQVAIKAQLAEFIESLKAGYQTNVGERGIRFSGGQRQRLGIARALYKNASVIVFDEATSALDNETERAVMEAIDALGSEMTILIIAHRLSTIKNCDCVVNLENGRIAAMNYNNNFNHT